MAYIKRVRILIIEHYKTILKIAIAMALILLIIFEGRSQLQTIRPEVALHLLRTIPGTWLLAFFAIGIVAAFSMVLYDLFGIKAFKYEIGKGHLIGISFVANTVNTLLGLGGLTGASVKTLLLKKRNIEIKELIPYNALLVSAATTGLSFFAMFSLLNLKNLSPLLNQHKWLLVCIIGYSFYIFIYFFIERFVKKFRVWADTFGPLKLFTFRLELAATSILEWLLAGVLIYVLAYYFNRGIGFMDVMSVFAAAAIAGILSFLPGGAGSFDLIAILGFQVVGLSPDQSLAVVILYRIFYYLIPSIAAMILFTLQTLKSAEDQGSLNVSGVYGQLVSVVVGLLVFISGVVLLVSGLTPGLIGRSRLMESIASLTFLQYSRSFSIAIGLMLLITSKEVILRVSRAYYVVMFLLFAGGISTFIKGFDVEELVFVLVAMAVLRISRTNFYRKSMPIKLSHLVSLAVLFLAFLIGYLKLSHFLFLSYIKTYHYHPLKFIHINTFISSGIFIYVLLILFIIFWYALRIKIQKDPQYQETDEGRLQEFLENNKGNHLSHLIHLGDKKLFWAKEGKILIAYSLSSDKAIVLGDPIGEKALVPEAIQEFQKFLDLYGFRSVFYEVDDENLSVYHDNGYYFFKMGEEAVVHLSSFDMAGSGKRSFRNVLRRFEKDGFGFQVLYPPFDKAFLDELHGISNEWLNGRDEKGFSIGWFDVNYLQKAPVAVVKDLNTDRCIAFVSITYHDSENKHIGIDLMRFKKDVPNSTMDYIFIQLFLHFKELGCRYFSLGVAPLSKVGYAPRSHLPEKIGHMIYQYGKSFYSFEGLRKYKGKFDPVWEPKYLAYPQLISLPALLIEITQLINGSKKRMKKRKPDIP